MQSVIYAVSFMLSVTNKPYTLSYLMVNVVMLSVVVLNVVAPFFPTKNKAWLRSQVPVLIT
jgi:hypothetical protein